MFCKMAQIKEISETWKRQFESAYGSSNNPHRKKVILYPVPLNPSLQFVVEVNALDVNVATVLSHPRPEA